MKRRSDKYTLTLAQIPTADTEFMRRPIRELTCPICRKPLAFAFRYINWDHYKCSGMCRGDFYRDAHWEDVGEHIRVGRRWHGTWSMCACGELTKNCGTGQNGAGVRWVGASVDHAWHVHSGVRGKDCCCCAVAAVAVMEPK